MTDLQFITAIALIAFLLGLIGSIAGSDKGTSLEAILISAGIGTLAAVSIGYGIRMFYHATL